MKCLIVDDDELNRDLVATMLGDAAVCEMAADGTEAVARFQEAMDAGEPFDLILQDIMMPGINGHETAKAIRQVERTREVPASKGVKIVMLTALNSHQDAMEAFYSAQTSAYVVKPVSRSKLMDVMSRLGLKNR